jgi:hypothetical protein
MSRTLPNRERSPNDAQEAPLIDAENLFRQPGPPLTSVLAQPISDQKKAVAFAFGTFHPRNPDGSPMTLPMSKPVEAKGPVVLRSNDFFK